MNSSSLKLAVCSAAIAITSVACTAAPAAPGDDVAIDVDTDQVAPRACPRGQNCTPPPTNAYTLEPTGGTTTGGTTTGGTKGGGKTGVYEPHPNQAPGIGITCEGPSGPGTYWMISTRNGYYECLSVEPAKAPPGTIPNGYSIISKYICPPSYPVLHCGGISYCTCWTS